MTAESANPAADGIPIRVRCTAFGFAGGLLPRDPATHSLTINTLVVLPIGAQIAVTLRDATTAKRVNAAARVERQLVEEGRRVGMVVELTSFDGDGAEALRDIIVTGLDAPAPSTTTTGRPRHGAGGAMQPESSPEKLPTPIPLPETWAPAARATPIQLARIDSSPTAVVPEPDATSSTAAHLGPTAEPVSMPEHRQYEGLVPDGLTLLVETDRLGPVTGVLAFDSPAGGLFVESQRELALGSALLVTLPDPITGEPVRTVCKIVRHVYGHAGDLLGTQLAFSSTDPALPEALADLLQAADASLQVVDRSPDSPALEGEQEIDVDVDLQERISDLVHSALIDAHGRRPAQAIDTLLKALALGPSNAAELHLRIAHIALDDLSDVDFARHHVREAERLAPKRADLRAILREIGARVGHRPRAERPARRPAKRRVRVNLPGRRLLVIAIVTLALLAGTGTWLIWRYILPRGPAPAVVAVTEIDDLVPASEARSYKKRLYVRVQPEWLGEPQYVRRRALEDLAGRARQRFGVRTVVLLDQENHLVASCIDGRITLAR